MTPVEPATFAAELISRLEKLKQEQETMDSLEERLQQIKEVGGLTPWLLGQCLQHAVQRLSWRWKGGYGSGTVCLHVTQGGERACFSLRAACPGFKDLSRSDAGCSLPARWKEPQLECRCHPVLFFISY